MPPRARNAPTNPVAAALTAAVLIMGALTACATVPRLHAADDVRALLMAVRDGDRAGFDAHVDRSALKTQLKSRLIAEAARRGGNAAAAGAFLAGPLVDLGVEAMVRPQVFRAEALRFGYDPNQPLPSVLAVAALVRPTGDGRACLAERRGGPCVFSFTDEGGVYRLSGYEGPLDRLAAASPPASPARAAPPRPR